jgi:hypothetical protein
LKELGLRSDARRYPQMFKDYFAEAEHRNLNDEIARASLGCDLKDEKTLKLPAMIFPRSSSLLA